MKSHNICVNPWLPLQEDAAKQEEGETVPAPTEARATEVHSQEEEEEASLTADALPEIVRMVTDIRAALTPAEGLADAGIGAPEASADEGSLQTLLPSRCRSFNKHNAALLA